MSTLRSMTLPSPIGTLTLVASDVGLRAMLFEIEHSGRHQFETVLSMTDPTLVVARRQLEEYFAKERTEFDLPLDPIGTEFQVMCWLALAQIPYGHTVSYGEQAAMVGRPTAVRAVGGANGRNPLAIVLPCHRVIGADGSLTGFGGGMDAKRFLLGLESDTLFP